MNNPLPILAIIAAYVYFVKIAGPAYMKLKKPYEIKGLILVYNLVMIMLSLYFFIKVQSN
jgi:fatty acyl-coA elongase, putative